MFSNDLKVKFFDTYIEYEKWKSENSYYDFMDVVNYLLQEIEFVRIISFIKKGALSGNSDSLSND
jgi:hypothetical protein